MFTPPVSVHYEYSIQALNGLSRLSTLEGKRIFGATAPVCAALNPTQFVLNKNPLPLACLNIEKAKRSSAALCAALITTSWNKLL